MKKVFIIAEAGVNHNGDMKIAKKLIDVACDVQADAIKFQTFKADNIVTKQAKKANYQQETTDKKETQLDMLKKLELTKEQHEELLAYCDKKNIMFLSTPFDIESIQLLKDLGLRIFKIPSGEITNFPYLKKIATESKKIILSTGMSTLVEVKDALCILKGAGAKNIALLHCNTQYPTPKQDVNLKAIHTLKETFNVEVGYSDHTQGIEISIAAVALGATIIEKHFTLDRCMQGPDHKASLEPEEFKLMVQAIRNVELALGDGIKQPSESEKENRLVVRKSIVAMKIIAKGEQLTKENITTKRPGTGMSAAKWDDVIGTAAIKNFKKDEMIIL